MNTTVYQLSADGHRGSAAVRRLVEHAPSTGALALWMQHRDVEHAPNDLHRLLDSPVSNDGLTLYYTPAMTDLALRTQTALVAHQVLHVAFRHAPRREALARQTGQLDDRLWNGVADALVNASLAHHDWMDLPAGSVQLDELLQRCLSIDVPLATSLQRWDAESLYRAIDDRYAAGGGGQDARRNARRRPGTVAAQSTEEAIPGSSSSPDQRAEPRADVRSDVRSDARADPGAELRAAARAEQAGADAAMHDGPRAVAARELFRTMLVDLLPGQPEPAEAAARNEREWRERLGRAHAADGFQSLLRVLGADNRVTRTPWQLVLRTRLARALNQEPDLSWSRPSRSWLANRGRTASGRRLPWEPGVTSQRAVPRLVVVLDVSGSVDDRQLVDFARELSRVQRVHRAAMWLIAGDDQVRCDRLVRVGTALFDEPPVAGGGGTDFTPLLIAAARHRPDLAIVLTDLDGPAGAEPPFPVLWATPRSSEAPTPFGSRLWLDRAAHT